MILQFLHRGRYSSQHPINTDSVSDKCQHLMKYDSSIKRSKNRKMYDLQISALPRQTALKCVEELLDGVFRWVWIQGIQVKVAGVAFRLYQCRKTRATQRLLKLLEKLEESPENKREIKKETELCWQQDNNLVPESQLIKAQSKDLTDGPSPQTVWLTRNWHRSIWKSWQNPEDSSWDQTGVPESMYTAFICHMTKTRETVRACDAVIKTDKNLELFLDGLSELSDSALNAVRELTVVFVQVPQQTGQWLWKIRDYKCYQFMCCSQKQ